MARGAALLKLPALTRRWPGLRRESSAVAHDTSGPDFVYTVEGNSQLDLVE